MPSPPTIPSYYLIDKIAADDTPESNHPHPAIEDDLRHLHAGTTSTLHIILLLDGLKARHSAGQGLPFFETEALRKNKH